MTDIVNGEIVPALSGWQALVLFAAVCVATAAVRGAVFICRRVRL